MANCLLPMFPADCITEQQNRNYAAIPDDTEVLITHAPPYGILDFDDRIHYGSKELLQRVIAVSPRLHLFGHIHRQHGITDNGTTRFSSGAIMHVDCTDLHAPNLIELLSACPCMLAAIAALRSNRISLLSNRASLLSRSRAFLSLSAPFGL